MTVFASAAAPGVTTAANVTYSTGTLSSGTAWVGSSVPTTSDVAVFSAATAPITASIGTGLSVAGLQLTGGSTTTISANGSNTLTLGSSGISFSTASTLALNAPIALSGTQVWLLSAAGQPRINLGSTLTTNGNALSIDGAAGSSTSRIVNIAASNTFGPEVTFGSGVNKFYIQAGNNTVTITGTNNLNGSFDVFGSGATANVTSLGNLGQASSTGTASPYIRGGSTFNYTGNTASSNKGFSRDTVNSNSTINVTTAGQTLTVSGSLATTSGTISAGWVFGGAGNLTLLGTINNGTNTTVAKNGTGTLTLSGSNAYTGLTTINDGVLAFSTKNALLNSSGITITPTNGIATLTYTGAADTFDRSITVSSGTGTVRNTGSGVLALTGTLSKNGSVLRFNTGTFSVGGLITGASANSDLVVDAATVTLTNSNNDYNGPTFVQNGGVLILGANNVISSTSAVTVDASTLTVAGFTDAIQSLTTAGNSTLGISVNGAATGALTMGNLTFGAGTDTLALTMTSPSLGRYTLLSYAGTRSGTFDSVTGNGNYNVVYGSATNGTIDLQLKANQAATFTLSPAATRVLVGGSTTLTGSIVNTSPANSADLGIGLATTGSLTASGFSSSSGATLAAGGTSTITASLAAGNTAGIQSWSITNTDANAITTLSTATGSITAYDAATAQLAYGGSVSGTNWTINLGEFNQGAGSSSPLAFGISNLLQSNLYTADLALASLTTTNESGAIFMDLTGTSFTPALVAGGTNAFSAWMSLATSGTFTNVYNLAFNSSKDGSSLGGTQNVRLQVTGIIVVPEPEAIALAGIGVGLAAWLTRRRVRRAA